MSPRHLGIPVERLALPSDGTGDASPGDASDAYVAGRPEPHRA